MEHCFSNICAFGTRYERAKGYSRVDFHTTEAPVFNEVKSTKNQDHASNAVDHISRGGMKIKNYSNDKSQNYKKIDYPHKFWQNYHNNSQFPTCTISFQASKQVKLGDDILSTVNMIKCFISKIGDKFTL